MLLAFRDGVTQERRAAIERSVGGSGARRLGPSVRVVFEGGRVLGEPLELHVPDGGVLRAVSLLRRSSAVEYAEPDYLMRADALPNDPSFGLQWADSNTGQAVPSQMFPGEQLGAPVSGAPGDDIGALKAWSVTTGSPSIVIGEVDTGVDYEHPDLAANVWSNPGGVGGCAKGTHGYDELSATCDPMDKDTTYGGHGTHIGGIMAAVGDNGLGVAGINWHSSILPVKWLSSAAEGEDSKLIEALQWIVRVKQEGVNVRVVNDSATFEKSPGDHPEALSSEIEALGVNDILFVTSAGNSAENDDVEADRRYPCGFDLSTEICVTGSDDEDKLASWASYGPHTVDLAAPGVSIYSTLHRTEEGGHVIEHGYGYLSGGSMASPQVAGAAALILSADPSLGVQELRARILEGVTPVPALAGKLVTGGILNVCKALPGCEPPPAGPPPSPVPSDPTRTPPSTPTLSPAHELAPEIGNLVISPASFLVRASRRPSGRARHGEGALIRYVDSLAARTVISVLAARSGVFGAHRRCAPGNAVRVAKRRGRCTLYEKVGAFSHSDRAGTNVLRFGGWLDGRPLRPGAYRLKLVPALAGREGSERSVTFTILSRLGVTHPARRVRARSSAPVASRHSPPTISRISSEPLRALPAVAWPALST